MHTIASGTTLLAVVVVFCSLWTRRNTWRHKWETACTLYVAFLAMALVLAAPVAGEWIGDRLYRITHLANLNYFLGNLCGLGAIGSIVFYAVSRLMPDADFRRWYALHIEAPAVAGVAVMFALFAGSHASDEPDVNFMERPVTGVYPAAYWVVYCSVAMYLLYHGARGFIDLRHDPESRILANLYLVATALGAISQLLRILTALVWSWQTPTITGFMLVAACQSAILFACGAAASWIRRVRWFTRHSGWCGVTTPRFQPRRSWVEDPPKRADEAA